MAAFIEGSYKYITKEKRTLTMGCRKKIKKIFGNPIVVSVLSAVVISVLSVLANGILDIYLIDYRLQNLETNLHDGIGALQNDIANINEDIENNKDSTDEAINDIEYELGILAGKVSVIESNNASSVVRIDSNGELGKAIKVNYKNYETIHDSENQKAYLGFEKLVAKDMDTQEEYTFSDLDDKTIIMNYTEDGEDVFFKGQLDDNGFWDGNCIINRYKDDKLTMIMDAVYNSGKLDSYKQVFSYTTNYGNDVWVVSKRKVEEKDVRSGETWMYFKDEEYIKNFSNDSLSDSNIINAENFMKSISLQIEGYYNGYTSEGKFNDSSEDAYLVKYNEDGSVRYLYVGQIKNGVGNDNTGNAWALSWGYANDGYYYYKGIFYDGKHDIPHNWEPISQEQIDTLVNPDDFNCSLKGLVAEDI